MQITLPLQALGSRGAPGWIDIDSATRFPQICKSMGRWVNLDDPNSGCPWCGVGVESSNHLFVECSSCTYRENEMENGSNNNI
ncbi:hypothetical protein V6N13_092180 [Hibiscus sabdariffa]